MCSYMETSHAILLVPVDSAYALSVPICGVGNIPLWIPADTLQALPPPALSTPLPPASTSESPIPPHTGPGPAARMLTLQASRLAHPWTCFVRVRCGRQARARAEEGFIMMIRPEIGGDLQRGPGMEGAGPALGAA